MGTDTTPDAMTRLGWARCTDSVADILRRGAWYPILEETTDGHVIVEVRRQRVRLSRVDVHVRDTPPEQWSIVVRTGVLRPTLGGGKEEVTTTYAVCPYCHERQETRGRPVTLTCLGCDRTAAVDWSETC